MKDHIYRRSNTSSNIIRYSRMVSRLIFASLCLLNQSHLSPCFPQCPEMLALNLALALITKCLPSPHLRLYQPTQNHPSRFHFRPRSNNAHHPNPSLNHPTISSLLPLRKKTSSSMVCEVLRNLESPKPTILCPWLPLLLPRWPMFR